MDCRSPVRRSAEFFAARTAVVRSTRRPAFAQAWTRDLRPGDCVDGS